MTASQAEKAGYSGRGDLGGWLCIVAAHAANRRSERAHKEQTLESSEALLLPTPDDDPEMAFLRREYREEMLAAFREALNSLSARDRNLLRYYFLDGLSIDKLGVIYGVHRVTASRWVNQVRETLCLRTREYLSRRVTLSESGFQHVLGLIESQIRLNLAEIPG
jgi:RNA polymerase sigma-70 factor (ECF subfamily)